MKHFKIQLLFKNQKIQQLWPVPQKYRSLKFKTPKNTPLILVCKIGKSKNCPPPPPPPSLLVMKKILFRYFFNLCITKAITKANLIGITILRMQTLLSYWNITATTIEITKVGSIRLQLHAAIYRPDSFALILCYCENLNAIRYEFYEF